MIAKPFAKSHNTRQENASLDLYAKEMSAPGSFNPSFVRVRQRTMPVFSSPPLAQDQQYAPCINCGHQHPELHNSSSANCFFITIRRSGRDRLSLSHPHSVTVPIQPATTPQPYQSQFHHLLRDYIWNEFESLKAEVDLDRNHISQHRNPRSPSKGQLKEKAPLPWLSWSFPTGQSGQTRNKANFFALWAKIMTNQSASMNRDVLVSSVLLPSSLDVELLGWNDHCVAVSHPTWSSD